MSTAKIRELEKEIFEKTQELTRLRAENPGTVVSNYEFDSLNGKIALKDLFAGREQLMLIHNMGHVCRYCTLWADGINAFLPHLESAMSVVLVCRDDVHTQSRMAHSRGWRFRMASHSGGSYIKQQTVLDGEDNCPGVVLYQLNGDEIVRKNSAVFGPYDEFCSIWNLLSLASLDTANWTPQHHYWQRPDKMDDGGQNLFD